MTMHLQSQPNALATIATALQTHDETRKTFYVGIEMRDATHSYQKLHYILLHFRAEKVSQRIWMLSIDQEQATLALQVLKQCLAPGDKMIVAKAAPAEPEQGRIAA